MQKQQFMQAIESQGYAIIQGILPPDILEPLKVELESSIQAEEDFRQRSRVPSHFGMVLLCPLYGGKMVEVLGLESLMQPFEWVLGEGCIIYAYTSSSMGLWLLRYFRESGPVLKSRSSIETAGANSAPICS